MSTVASSRPPGDSLKKTQNTSKKRPRSRFGRSTDASTTSIEKAEKNRHTNSLDDCFENDSSTWEAALKKRKLNGISGAEKQTTQDEDPPDTRKDRIDGGQQKTEKIGEENPDLPDRKQSSNETKDNSAGVKKSVLSVFDNGGTYIPPHRRRALEIGGKTDSELKNTQLQRESWDLLKKRINGLINKVNEDNLPQIAMELFEQNLVRGAGLFCRSLLKSQLTSPEYSAVYSSLMCVINSKLPELGELFLHRLLDQLHRGLKMKKKLIILNSMKFIAFLYNQQMFAELLPLQILTVFLESPTDDSIELAAEFLKLTGALLLDSCPKALEEILAVLREILQEGTVSLRAQYKIEEVLNARRRGFAEVPPVKPGLDLVETDDKITHEISFEEPLDLRKGLNVYKMDEDYESHEHEYNEFRQALLGVESEDGTDGTNSENKKDDGVTHRSRAEAEVSLEGGDEEQEDSKQKEITESSKLTDTAVNISEAELTDFRRRAYLTIMSAIGYEECTHKLIALMRANPGKEGELCNMVIECCSQEKTFMRYYAFVGRRLCALNSKYSHSFERSFAVHYATIHRFELRKIRNIGCFYASLLATESLSWSVFQIVLLKQDETTSSSRIFLKHVFQHLAREMTVSGLTQMLGRDSLRSDLTGLFPADKAENARFAINFFTEIKLGALTDELREKLNDLVEREAQAAQHVQDDSESSSVSSSSSVLSSSSSSSSVLSDSSDEALYRRQLDRTRGDGVREEPPRVERRPIYPEGGRGMSRKRPHSESRSPLRNRIVSRPDYTSNRDAGQGHLLHEKIYPRDDCELRYGDRSDYSDDERYQRSHQYARQPEVDSRRGRSSWDVRHPDGVNDDERLRYRDSGTTRGNGFVDTRYRGASSKYLDDYEYERGRSDRDRNFNELEDERDRRPPERQCYQGHSRSRNYRRNEYFPRHDRDPYYESYRERRTNFSYRDRDSGWRDHDGNRWRSDSPHRDREYDRKWHYEGDRGDARDRASRGSMGRGSLSRGRDRSRSPEPRYPSSRYRSR